MHCDLLTVFPELIQAVGAQSMMKRAIDFNVRASPSLVAASAPRKMDFVVDAISV